jgi:hypothetical protein
MMRRRKHECHMRRRRIPATGARHAPRPALLQAPLHDLQEVVEVLVAL